MSLDPHRCDEAARQIERAEELLDATADGSCRHRVEALVGAAAAHGSAEAHLQHIALPCPNAAVGVGRVSKIELRLKGAERDVLRDCFPAAEGR